MESHYVEGAIEVLDADAGTSTAPGLTLVLMDYPVVVDETGAEVDVSAPAVGQRIRVDYGPEATGVEGAFGIFFAAAGRPLSVDALEDGGANRVAAVWRCSCHLEIERTDGRPGGCRSPRGASASVVYAAHSPMPHGTRLELSPPRPVCGSVARLTE